MKSVLKNAAKAVLWPGAKLMDRRYEAKDIPAPTRRTAHQGMRDYIVETFDRPGVRVLEIGSRNVTGPHNLRSRFQHAEYVGFDYYDGGNVDVVGDAHRLSEFFAEPFDVVYSTAVFEHLAMPWIVAEQIAKVLKFGGHAFTETHFSTSSHERPWHFFQFSDMALRALFSPALGFECVEASMSNPIVGRYSLACDSYLRLRPAKGLYCHSAIMAKKVREAPGFAWSPDQMDAITGSTHYPEHTGVS